MVARSPIAFEGLFDSWPSGVFAPPPGAEDDEEMIHAVLIFNNSGRPRLSRFYTPMAGGSGAEQRALRLIFSLVSRRPEKAANFADAPELQPLLASFVGAGPPAAAPKPAPFDGEPDASVDTCPLRIIYRQFATLYFVFVVDAAESELGILDLIQVGIFPHDSDSYLLI